MARVELIPTDMSVTANSQDGVAFVGVAGIADGHMFRYTGREYLLITKSSADGIVTFPVIKLSGNQVIEPKAVTVLLASVSTLIDDFTADFLQSDNMVHIDYAAAVESEFTVQVFRKA